MLDSKLVLNEIETLLDEHYVHFQQRQLGQVQVYQKPQSSALTPRPQLAAPKPKSSPVSEMVVNVFMLFLFTVLADKLANQ